MRPLFIERPEIAARYRSDFVALTRLALEDSPAAHKLDRERVSCLSELVLARTADHVTFDQEHHDFMSVLSTIDFPWLRAGLQEFRGRLSPLLSLPKVLAMPIATDASSLLQDIFVEDVHGSLVKKLLDAASHTAGDKRFRTEIIDGEFVIKGENSATIGSLSGLAHELGHGLFEHLTSSIGPLELGSEAFAMTFEEVVVEHFIACASDRASWSQYQRRVDALNVLMYVLEHEAVSGLGSELLSQIGITFDVPLLLLRESLFSKPGYQYLYAKASSIRARVLGHRLPCAEVS